MNTTLSRLDNKLKTSFNNSRHLEEASNGIYMTCERNNVTVDDFLNAVEDGSAFKLTDFRSVNEANFFDHVDPKFKRVAMGLVNITAGGNGGMASIGRGEFAITLLSNLDSKMITEGKGDILHSDGTYEEVKFNGGKINVSGARGRDIYKGFLNNLNGIKLKHKDFLPFRKEEGNRYSNLDLEKLNASYGEVVLGHSLGSISNNKLKELFLNRAMANVFQQVDSLLVMDTDGSYVRFKNAVDGENYYKNLPNGIGSIGLELRANQDNPASIYLFTKNHKDYQ